MGFMSPQRLRQSRSPGRNIAEEAESDRSRVMFSAAFRRLQEKAQVFSLEENAAVRTRLTHSLEVSHIGRYIARKSIEKGGATLGKIGLCSDDEKRAAITVVETACLLHDIGNPPFGHFGEKVIRHWFEKNKESFEKSLGFDTKKNQSPSYLEFKKYYTDLIYFDGNPQGFRIVSKLQWNHDENGLNLTAMQLASLLKYNKESKDFYEPQEGKVKPGYFCTERQVIQKVWKTLDMIPMRHPLSYLMEAADDIAYCLSDIEDGIEKGLLNGYQFFHEVKNYNCSILSAICDESGDLNRHGEDETHNTLKVYLNIKTKITNVLVDKLAQTFVDKIEEISSGSFESLLCNNQEAKEVLDFFKMLAQKYLYNSRVVRENELIANRVITGILDSYKPLLEADKDRFNHIINLKEMDLDHNSISVEQALYLQFAKKFINVYRHDLQENTTDLGDGAYEWFLRAHLVIDQISGMTDKFALSKFRLICSP